MCFLFCGLRPRRVFGALGPGLVLLGLVSCQPVVEPYPVPLPPNIRISSQPRFGATVDVGTASSLTLQFSRRMDPASLRGIRRVSFLLPISVDQLTGSWNADTTQIVFGLTQFPVQPGATYEAVFAGLRTADGELYNAGPYKVRFRTRGEPDVFPMRPQARVATRAFCHGEGGDPCATIVTRHESAFGIDTLLVETRCESCTVAERRDLYRRTPTTIEWLGFDAGLGALPAATSTRWPHPPSILALPTSTGNSLTAEPQVAGDGTRLVAWNATDSGTDSPVYLFGALGAPVQVAFDDSRVVDLDYTLGLANGVTERHRERWWLYPGVGLVRREAHIERSDDPALHDELETYTPSIGDFLAF